jgi:hypothetical protein
MANSGKASSSWAFDTKQPQLSSQPPHLHSRRAPNLGANSIRWTRTQRIFSMRRPQATSRLRWKFGFIRLGHPPGYLPAMARVADRQPTAQIGTCEHGWCLPCLLAGVGCRGLAAGFSARGVRVHGGDCYCSEHLLGRHVSCHGAVREVAGGHQDYGAGAGFDTVDTGDGGRQCVVLAQDCVTWGSGFCAYAWRDGVLPPCTGWGSVSQAGEYVHGCAVLGSLCWFLSFRVCACAWCCSWIG